MIAMKMPLRRDLRCFESNRQAVPALPEVVVFSEPRRIAAARWRQTIEGAAFTERGSALET
jgi:hypothetical protein